MAIVISKHYTGSKPIGNGIIKMLPSANTPDYSFDDWYINPNLSEVNGYEIKYWKIHNNQIKLMTESEQNLVNSYVEASLKPSISLIGFEENNDVCSTTSTNPQNKLTLTIDNLINGAQYKIWWYCELGTYRRNEAYMNITINNNIIAQSTKSIYVHNYNNMLVYEAVSGANIIDNISGTNIIKLNYCDLEWGGSSVYIRNAKIGCMRV